MYSLPEELHLDILLRLSVKSLLTCRYVCKSWFQLISDPSFAKSHLNLLAQEKNPSFILASYRVVEGNVISSLSYHSSISASPTQDLCENLVELDYPFKSEGYIIESVGSCNGLVYLKLSTIVKDYFLCLWNPATAEYKTLPNPPKQPFNNGTFGYENMANDYMLVAVHINFCRSLSMYIYTLRSNLWKRIQGDPYKFYPSVRGIFVNGSFRMLVKTGNHKVVIICLDMRNEKLVEMQLPKEALENMGIWPSMDLGVIKGSPCLLVRVYGVCWEVWVMRDYGGVRESWTKTYVINLPYDPHLRLLWSFENGEILLEMGTTLILYDDKVRAISEEPILKNLRGVENYVESLVSLNSGQYVKKNRENEFPA